MKREQMDITTLWADLAVEELVRSGVTTFIISPGSRSTPLALAVGRNSQCDIITHFDERGAGFVAVGYARARHKPAALICTSGTAVANYLPSVVEASMDHLPLLVLTADRPPELHDTGANQTIPQEHIFGDFVRWQFTLPCPIESIPPEIVLDAIDQAVHRARGSNAGPVHLNFQFREPLIPGTSLQVDSKYLESILHRQKGAEAYAASAPAHPVMEQSQIDQIVSIISKAESGLLVVGRLEQRREELEAVVSLADRLGWPVVTDIGSGLRLGTQVGSGHLPYFDLSLPEQSRATAFDCILHLGGPIVSKRAALFFDSQTGEYVQVNDRIGRQDGGHRVTRRVVSDIRYFAETLITRLPSTDRATKSTDFTDRDNETGKLLVNTLDSGPLCEPLVPRLIARQIDKEHALFLASSLTVRDFDMYAPTDGRWVPVGCNRGASGIDGTVASAVGFARGNLKPTTLVIGDTALLHDLNSLTILSDSKTPPVTSVAINNGGGAIFSMLPGVDVASDTIRPGLFERLFVQKHPFTFRAAAEMFALPYVNPADTATFEQAYRDFTASGRSSIIELTFDWRKSREIRLNLHEQIIACLRRR